MSAAGKALSALRHATFGKPVTLHEPQSLIAFEDHLSYSHRSPVHFANGLPNDVPNPSDSQPPFDSVYGVPSPRHPC